MAYNNTKITMCLILQLWGSEARNGSHWAKIKLWAGLCSILEALEEILFPCLFQLLGVTLYACDCLPSQGWSSEPSLSCGVFLTASLLPLSSPFKDLCGCIGSTWIIQASLFMLRSPD